MSQSPEAVRLEDLEAGQIIREIQMETRGDALKFCHQLLDFINGQKVSAKAWGSYTLKANYCGRGIDSVELTDHHSIKFKFRGENGA